MSECKCTLVQSLVGDGCRVCQPDAYIDMIETHLKEADKRIEALEEIRAAVEDVEEINPSNFDIDQVCAQNNALIEVWQILEALNSDEVSSE